MNSAITMEEMAAMSGAHSYSDEPVKNKRKPMRSTDSDGKEPKDSAQIEFAAFLKASTSPFYKALDGVIYEYVGTHWRVLGTEQGEKMAFMWLSII